MSHNRPHISIVLPVRNGAKYISGALESIFQQTYPHFTILVLENSSEDGTPDILRTFHDPRLQVFPSTTALPIEANWKRILDLPLSEWMTIISHDDLLYPTFLDEIIALIETESDASLYTSHFNLIDADGEMIRPAHPMAFRESGDEFLHKSHTWQADSFGTGYVMRSDDYRSVGGIPSFPGLYYADDVLWANLANIKSRVCSPKTLYAYRYYRSSSGRHIDLPGLYRASGVYLDYLQTRPYFEVENRSKAARNYVTRHLSRHYQRFLVNLISERNPEQMQNYQRLKAELQAMESQDGRFAVYNWVLRLIEKVAWIPFRSGRVWTLRLMENAAIWLRQFTD